MKKNVHSAHSLFNIICFITVALQLLFLRANGTDTIPKPGIILRSVLVNTVEKRYEKAPSFSYDENNFQFTYEGIDLSFTGQMEYRYRLKPGDKWEMTHEKTLLFPSLPAGAYNFEVEVKNDTSEWSDPAVYAFKLIPPLYFRWWFIVSSVLILSILIVWMIRIRNKRLLNRQHETFRARLRMNEMENQAKQAMMNPHFIFNALNSIQQYMNDNDRVAANKYLTKFSRLIRLNLDLVNKDLITLEEELEKLKLYLEIEQLRFGEKLAYEFIIDAHLETDIIYIPSMILQPFVENAIWHGLMPSGKNGCITLKAESSGEGKMLRLQIVDDGIGIMQSKQLNKAKNHKSLGTELTIDRLKLFAKKYGEEGFFSMKDRAEENESQHGTVVTLEVPLVFEDRVDQNNFNQLTQ